MVVICEECAAILYWNSWVSCSKWNRSSSLNRWISQTLFYTVLNSCDLFAFSSVNHRRKSNKKKEGKKQVFANSHTTDRPTDRFRMLTKLYLELLEKAESHTNNLGAAHTYHKMYLKYKHTRWWQSIEFSDIKPLIYSKTVSRSTFISLLAASPISTAEYEELF